MDPCGRGSGLGAWAGFLLWWVGYWVMLAVLSTLVAYFVLGPLHCPAWVPPVVGVVWATLVAASRCQETCEAGDAARNWRRARGRAEGQPEEPRWEDAFIGMFAGPVMAAFLSWALYQVGERLGIPPPEDVPVGSILILGAWLGIFTWVSLGTPGAVTRGWLRVSGAIALATIAANVIVTTRGPDGTWSAEAVVERLYAFGVPLAWATMHLACGCCCCGPADDGAQECLPEGPDDGAGSPAAPPPEPPERTGLAEEPVPESDEAPV